MVTQQGNAHLYTNVRELADWNFPLSQVLDKYYSLLEEDQASRINFTEVALVIQDFADAYAQKVDKLFNEVLSINQIISECSKENETEKTSKNRRGLKKTIDFEDFQPLDFTKEIGKNINLKSHSICKQVKLISRRFPQLENFTYHNSSFEIQNVHGEIIGKKYEFRCTQHFNKFGMLVDEFIPDDFLDNISPTDKVDKSVNKSLVQLTNGLAHDSSISENESSKDNGVSSRDSGYNSSFNITDNFDISLPDVQSPISDCSVDNHEPETSLPENINNVNSQNSLLSSNDQEKENDLNDIEPEKNKDPESQNVANSEKSTCQNNKNKRGRNALNKDNLNKQAWEPIAFTHGIPNRKPKRRTKFKLPCNIALLKSERRKRKLEKSQPQCIAEFLANECNLPYKKLSVYSPTRPDFPFMKKEEIEDFQKSFNECFIKANQDYDSLKYKAVTTITMDLLGFVPNFTENDSVLSQCHYQSKSFNTETPSISCFLPTTENSLTSISEDRLSPLMSTNQNDDDDVDDGLSMRGDDEFETVPDYQKRVESRKQAIFDESDVFTTVDHAVAKWHEAIQPKLSEIMKRPEYDVQQYRSKIINRLERCDNKSSTFDSLVNNQPPFEVARLLSASLYLANKYNVEIKENENDNNFVLTLLNTTK